MDIFSRQAQRRRSKRPIRKTRVGSMGIFSRQAQRHRSKRPISKTRVGSMGIFSRQTQRHRSKRPISKTRVGSIGVFSRQTQRRRSKRPITKRFIHQRHSVHQGRIFQLFKAALQSPLAIFELTQTSIHPLRGSSPQSSDYKSDAVSIRPRGL